MTAKRFSKNRLVGAIFGVLFGIIGVVGGINLAPMAYAEPVNSGEESVESVEGAAGVVEKDTSTEATEEEVDITNELVEETRASGMSCQNSLGAIGWLVCPTTGKIAEAVDWLYDKIENVLVINPVEMKDGSPIYEIWKYMLGITNIVFIIFFLVMVYSQITGMGITNYGLKKTLPKLIVAAILVNLSFLICSLVVDVSNIVGSSLRGVFTSIEEATMSEMTITGGMKVSDMYGALAGGSVIALGAGMIAFETGAIWMLIPTVLGAIVAVVTGLVTIAMRQAVVALLIMISPLAMVAYMLPNTEQWFKKWRQLLTKMLVFYPMFSLLFGASQLAGFAIIASASDGFGVLLGVAVQIFPLFFSWSLMKMSGTILGTINSKLNGLAARPLAANRSWADSHRELTKQKKLAQGNVYSPSLRLAQFLSDRKVARDEKTKEYADAVKLRGQAYAVRRNYKGQGDNEYKYLSKEGEESYSQTIRNIGYNRIIDQHKHTFNDGVGGLGANKAQTERLKALDDKIIRESDKAKMETVRGELIDARNAESFYNRMDDAINAHMDELNGYEIDKKTGARERRKNYKFHFDDRDKSELNRAVSRYADAEVILGRRPDDIQIVAANAAQAYDAQKKILEAKMQKYYELLPPTKDLEYRLSELTTQKDASKLIDAIIPGLRILNQRGDTDLVKAQLNNLLDKDLGGGIKLGTHASQSLASFLMFEVKDNDPALRRFGKYINLETARAYNENDRKVMDVTYDEYIKGYHDGEPITKENPTGRMYAKKDMIKLVEGTSFDNIERTALPNLDDSLKQAYGYKKGMNGEQWDVAGYLKKREEIQTAFEPAFLSASLKWLSGSEQINSGVKFWTGYDLKQQKDKNGQIVTDGENGPAVYGLSPVWNEKEFAGKENEVRDYYRRKTMDYFKDQTTNQILGMRTDYRDATMEHLLETYLNGESEDETSEERREKYENARADIQGKTYEGKTPKETEELRKKELKKLKMELAGRQLREILGETGKLEQIYRTRRSGTANNAKDWFRGWVGLDDEEAMGKEVAFYEKERAKKRQQLKEETSTDPEDGFWKPQRIYDEGTRKSIRDNLDKIWKDNEDLAPEDFYKLITDKALKGWFGDGPTVIGHKFEEYYEANKDYVDTYKLKDTLNELLNDPDNYPDA